MLGQTLALIEKESTPERLHLLGLLFKLKLLDHLGLKPRVEACVRCGDGHETEVVFDVEAGGILCRTCAQTGLLRIVSFWEMMSAPFSILPIAFG